jgi:hypothetical protein
VHAVTKKVVGVFFVRFHCALHKTNFTYTKSKITFLLQLSFAGNIYSQSFPPENTSLH